MNGYEIRKTACIGAGLIGSSWATLFSRFGCEVALYDISAESLNAAADKIAANFAVFVRSGIMTPDEVRDATNLIRYEPDFEKAIRDAQLIQECGAEKLEVKREILKQIDAVNTTAPVCSSTSGLNISDISAESPYASRCVGAHPYNPPHLMPLIEITKWDKTDDKTVKACYDFYKSMNKEPVILNKESPGFICNRLQGAFLKEAIEIVMEGVCSVEDLDKAAVYGLGVRWAIVGPNLNGELNGGDGGIAEYLGPKYRPNMNKRFQRILSSKITEVPVEYAEKIAPEGVEEEKRNRPPETGNTREEIIAYRDKLLMEILKLHGKI